MTKENTKSQKYDATLSIQYAPDIPAENNKPKVSEKQYQAMKRSLRRKEQANTHRIYLIPCAGNKGWYEMGERSALFYYYEIVKRYALKYRFFEDSLSFHDPYEIGYIHTPGLNDVRHWLKQARLYLDEGYDSQRTFYFELTKNFTDDEIAHYLAKEQQRRLDSLAITPAHNLSPEFYQLLINLGQRIHRVCNNRLDRLTCDTLGVKVTNLVDGALRYYHYLTYYTPNTHDKILAKWQNIYANLCYALIDFKVLSDFKLLDRETCVSIDEVLNRLINISKREIARTEKAKITPKSAAKSAAKPAAKSTSQETK